MEALSALRIVIELTSFPEVLDGQKVIGMKLGDEEYMMLLVKANPMAYQMVTDAIPSHFGTNAITGMAFDYNASLKQGHLVTHPDPKATGVSTSRRRTSRRCETSSTSNTNSVQESEDGAAQVVPFFLFNYSYVILVGVFLIGII